jgi:hypothetical protein
VVEQEHVDALALLHHELLPRDLPRPLHQHLPLGTNTTTTTPASAIPVPVTTTTPAFSLVITPVTTTAPASALAAEDEVLGVQARVFAEVVASRGATELHLLHGRGGLRAPHVSE